MKNFYQWLISLKVPSHARAVSCTSCLKIAVLLGLSGAPELFLQGCSSASAPLSIKMYNPETKQTLTCNASDQLARTDPAVLAVAVENCAEQLEARGFVREK